MNEVLKDAPFAIVYLNDIIIYSKTAEEHLDDLQQVFHKLCNAKLSMKLSKCHFFAKEIKYFGHVLSATIIKPLPLKKQKPLNSCIHQGMPNKCKLSLAL